MRLRPVSFALFALTTFASGAALAQSWGARLVGALDSVGRTDLLTDPSGRIPVSAILPPGVTAAALGMVPFEGGTASMRLTPGQVIALGDAFPEVELAVGPPLKPLLDFSKTWTRSEKAWKDTGFDGKGVVVGVVDTGIDILHADFRNEDGTTRIKWLLQTGLPSAGKHPEMEQQYCGQYGSQCAILNADDINGLILGATPSTGGTFDATGHGTHVASIAAGNGGAGVNGVKRYVGVARSADLIIGALESFVDDDVSSAAAFVFDRAEDLKEACVLNVSLGSDYGAHDGSDILDRRLAALVGDDKPGRAITVAAGNSGGLWIFDGQDDPWGIHTEAHVYPHADVRVPIYAPKSKTGRGFLWVTFDRGDEVSVALEGPGGSTWVGFVPPGHEAGFDDGKRAAGVVNGKFKEGASLAPVTNGAVAVWSGSWDDNSEFAVHLSGHGHAQLWLTSTGDLAQSTGLLFKRAIRQGTINVPASSPSLLAVGCTLNRLAWPTVNGPNKPVTLDFFGGDEDPKVDSVCYFSSAGPTPQGLAKPEISAPGGFVAAAMASTADPRVIAGSLFDAGGCPPEIPNCFVADETHGIAAGTSMSSPQVAGAIAMLFQKDPTLTQAQVTAILQAGARYPRGKVPNEVQLGPGELDVVGAFLAMGEEQAEFANPDVKKSWYVLSSAYARPDVQSEVWGTVELRRADGEVAHALDGTYLALDVKNGTVVSPLAKVRHGLYRFAVAGRAGQSGQEMTIDVTYAGKSLGVKTLPIQNDVWSEREPIEATGSCAVASAGAGDSRRGSRAPSDAPMWLAAAVGGLVVLRRARATWAPARRRRR